MAATPSLTISIHSLVKRETKFLVAFDHTDGVMQAFFDRSSGESTLVYFRDVVTAMEAADILNAELEESK